MTDTGLADAAPAPQSRLDRVVAAAETWADSLADAGGRGALLSYRDLKVGMLDLANAEAEPRRKLVDGLPTPVTRLFPHDPLRSAALRSAHAIHSRMTELRLERGIECGYLAVGFATWSDPFAPRRPNAPLLLRAVSVVPRGATRADYVLQVQPDVAVNPVLLEAMTAQLGIRIDAEDLRDHSGRLRYPSVVERLRELAPAHVVDGFTITHRAVIGCFTHATDTLAEEIRRNARRWASNDLVAALAGDQDAAAALAARPLSVPDPDNVDPEFERLVLDADASQSAVIESVLSGGNAAVSAAPGSGASQMLANLVVGLVESGQRVLVVAQKRTALEAIAERLDRVGLAELAIDLPEGAAATRAAEEALGRVAPAGVTAPRAAPSDDLRELVTTRAALQSYRDDLHAGRRPWGVSSYDAWCGALATPPEARCDVRLAGRHLEALAGETHQAMRAAIKEWAELGGAGIRAERTPWFAATPATQEHARAVEEAVHALVTSSLSAAERATSLAAADLGLPAPRSLAEAAALADLFVGVDETQQIFEPSIWDAPLAELVAATADRAGRRELGAGPGWLARRALRHELDLVLRDPQALDDAARHQALVEARARRAAWDALAADGHGPRLGLHVQAAVDAVDVVSAQLSLVESAHPTEALDSPDFATLTARLRALADDAATLLRMPRLNALVARLERAGLGPLLEALRGREAVSTWSAVAAYDYVRFASIAASVSRWSPKPDLPNVGPSGTGSAARGTAVFDVAARETLTRRYRRADLAHLADTAARAHQSYLRRVEAARSDHLTQATVVDEFLRGSAGRPTVRELVVTAPNLIFAMKPCWMMPPVAVPQLLPDQPLFDVVLIDAAGRLEAAHAVAALARAVRVVLVGDDRQLPPAPMPAAVGQAQAEASVDSARPAVGPSVFDLLGSHLPAFRLDGHYRSRDERLVAFSNTMFYEGALATVPGAAAPDCLSFEVVPQAPGAKDQEDSSDAEIERVVALVQEHARTRPDESLGVVTLGRHHAERIEAALRRALDRQPGLEPFFGSEADEPFFVLPVDQVQGDERDAIILSMGFGRAADGRLLYRFGPLTQPGGGRWLNVAITRARRRMHVLSSFSGDELEPRRLAAEGARLLRAFLSYAAAEGALPRQPIGSQVPAAAGTEPTVAAAASSISGAHREPVPVAGGPDGDQWIPQGQLQGESQARPTAADPLEADIAARLAGSGLDVVRGLGWSGRRIPVAIRHPRRRSRFVLAVETDGPTYRGLATVRDRERLRDEHLERLGWRVHHVWAAEWFANPGAAVDRLLEAYKASVTEADALDAAASGPAGSAEAFPAVSGARTTAARQIGPGSRGHDDTAGGDTVAGHGRSGVGTAGAETAGVDIALGDTSRADAAASALATWTGAAETGVPEGRLAVDGQARIQSGVQGDGAVARGPEPQEDLADALLGERGRRPEVGPGRPFSAYSPRSLAALATWLESDSVLRSEDDVVGLLQEELGLTNAGQRVDAALRRAVRVARMSPPESRPGVTAAVPHERVRTPGASQTSQPAALATDPVQPAEHWREADSSNDVRLAAERPPHWN